MRVAGKQQYALQTRSAYERTGVVHAHDVAGAAHVHVIGKGMGIKPKLMGKYAGRGWNAIVRRHGGEYDGVNGLGVNLSLAYKGGRGLFAKV